MGCFNKMGFYSHLPITAGDEIVMFICVDNTQSNKSNNNPIYIDEFYAPFCLPIYGTYDEYGFIENIVKDANTDLLEKKFGKSVEDILRLIYDYESGYPTDIAEKYVHMFKDVIEKDKVPTLILTMERKDVFDAMVKLSDKPYFDANACNLWHNIGDFWLSQLGFIKKEKMEKYNNFRYVLDKYEGEYYVSSNGHCPHIINSKTLAEYPCYKGFQDLIRKWKEFTGIELKFKDENLYDKNIIDLSFDITKEVYYTNFKYENNDIITNETNITDENLINIIKDYKRLTEKIGKGNFFTEDHYVFVYDGETKFPNDIIPFNMYCCLLFRGSMHLYDDYYNIFTDEFKGICCKFAKFNYTLRDLCGKYDVSMYGNQSVSDRFYLNNFAKLNNSYSQIIEKLYKRYDDIEETE